MAGSFENALHDVKARFGRVLPVKKLSDEQPLRAELFSIEQFKIYAVNLAEKHRVNFKRGREILLSRLKENEEIILRTYELLDETGKSKRNISPAGEWLLDNYYLIKEQIRLAQKFLPKGYSRELPNLAGGPLAGYPRVYDIAMEMVSHGDGRMDIAGLTGFVASYQTVKYLKLGELWGIPIMIRLALIENLRRVSSNLMLMQVERDRADYWAGRMLEVSSKDTNAVVREIASMAKDDLQMSDSFVAEFVRRLHGQSSALNLPLIWLEKKLSEKGETIDRLIQSTGQKQASNQVSIANTIESLRVLENTNWHDFVEELSAVEKTLRTDPSGDYASMSFDTRDNYRHVIEDISARSRRPEEEIASLAVRMAGEARALNGEKDVTAHIGYYLIDRGLIRFYSSLGIRFPLSSYFQAKKTVMPLIVYMGSIAVLTAAAAALSLYMALSLGVTPGPLFIIFGIPILFVASQTAVSLVNWASTIIISPDNLPRMDFSEGVPDIAHTLVVIPAMLGDERSVDSLIENIEVSYLANSDDSIDFALLTDFHDALRENMPGDDGLIARAGGGIEKLNNKYRRRGGNIFYLFHRNRSWNEREKVWIGYERKRGKLSDLNSLLRGAGREKFSVVIGDTQRLQNVKYVLTLDTDTRIPRNTARELAGIMAHPLNRPRYDEKKKRVTAGYGILQPRVEASYPGENPSLFVKIFGGESGIDPYTRAVSDVYQDLFYEGSFIGKGLYDVDAFERSMRERLPENLILSHDMLEGCYARSALVTDVQLCEEYPRGYLDDISRRRRWIRGDWQIARWLFSFVPGFRHEKVKNPISFISKWKIFDNLRRSLVPASTAMLFLLGWTFVRYSWKWTLFVMLLSGISIPLRSLAEIARKPAGITLTAHLNSAFSSLSMQTVQFCLSLAFVVYEGFVSLGAVITTLWRVLISRRRLLEWSASTRPGKAAEKTILECYKIMFASPLTVIIYAAVCRPAFDAAVLFLMGMWVLSPAIAGLISSPPALRRVILSEPDIHFLRRASRRTWNFFETFVTAQDNWLPPDNFQEDPLGAVAHRTSPTNIGLALLSNLAAYDFGYISTGLMLERTRDTLSTMNGMEKFRGHFYNWYETETLKPMKPLYISSVDSGNLTGHLIVLRSGLMEMQGKKIISGKIFDGLADTLDVMEESLKEGDKSKPGTLAEPTRRAAELIRGFRERIKQPPGRLMEMHALLRGLSADISGMLPDADWKGAGKAGKWAGAFEKQCYDYLEEISFLAPWALLPTVMPGMWENGDEKQKTRLALLREELRRLDDVPTLSDTARLETRLIPVIDGILENMAEAWKDAAKAKEWLGSLKNAVKQAGTRSSERIREIDYLTLLCGEMSAVEYEFLYSRSTHLLSIGYNVSERKPDPACYDLLASEARLCSFVAIAQGRIPQDHWFMLGRLLSKHGGDPVLVSWGGSMFEYLMPLLVMPTYEGTLLDRTYKTIIGRQIEYAGINNIPWGISESGYNKLDAGMIYQYRSFGVPDTGFKRGLSEDLVVAPYASALALMVEPEKACRNLEYLNENGFAGEYGFFEAVDYTPSRLAPDETFSVVRSYMAHHQGMALLSFAYSLLDKPMQRRFLADPMFKATELLLQERVPNEVPFLFDSEATGPERKVEEREALLRVFTNPGTPMPEVHLLSNGKYSVMVNNSGGGYSRWKDLAVTRWHEDAALDNDGTFIYLRDTDSGEFWSAAYQPTLQKSKKYEAVFSRSRAEFKRRDHFIDTHTEIAVSPEDDIELRRVTLTNRSRVRRVIELTSYAEVVMNYPSADLEHRTFGNLFIETEIIRSHQAIICSRRPRSEKDAYPSMLHLMAVHGNSTVGASYETDRGKFIGRLNTLSDPAAMHDNGYLSDSDGAVIDPIVSIRCRVSIEPEQSATIDYVTAVCPGMERARELMEKYRDRNLADRVFDLAWTHGQVALQQINVGEEDAQLFGRLASAIVYAGPSWRAHASILKRNFRGQPDLWGYGISGELPIALVRIEDPDNIGLIERMVRAHSYWRMNGLAVDLVIWNEDHSVYRDVISEKINGLISENAGGPSSQPGGIFMRRTDQMSEEDKILMQTVARVIITDRGGTLAEQINCTTQPAAARPLFVPIKKAVEEKTAGTTSVRSDLAYFNGLGGFTRDGREYVVNTGPNGVTPAPWVNVLANRGFGTVISESGSAYTWSENAHEFRLTPWKNDPVTDAGGEAMYMRDEETGQFWSTAPMPAGGEKGYTSRHGFGYTVFEHTGNGISTELTVFVSPEYPVKFSLLKIKNISGRKRKISATTYNELVMGTIREKNHMYVATEIDPKSGAILAYNHYNKGFPGRVVFHDTSETARFVSGDRNEFLGRNGSMARPAAMQRDRLSGKTGAGLDPCACLQVRFALDEAEEKETAFMFGAGKDLDEARAILQRFNGTASIRRELENVWEYWKRNLGVVYVETPDESLNFLVNGWLQYQTIACRLWGRSGYYQSGGAFGYRDQLQDVMSLMHSHPEMVREQLVAFAARQFVEGDVQHWWHPPSGRGIRSNCSDDYLWLPFVACLYVGEIGDTGVLDEKISFLDGPQVKPGEESYYGLPGISDKTGTLYEHCVAAVKRSLKFGVHGLPLMGSGDWNDGMNLVGREGKGESVWLAFFLHQVLDSMEKIAGARGDAAFSGMCHDEAEKLSRNIDENGWDGDWYRRAYYDSGEAIGSSSSEECRIDSVPQSWAVITGVAGPERARKAMDQVDMRLVDRENSLIKIFEPPFDKSVSDPGYIKGYVPGVRENGGQYTHAAIWTVIAFAALKDKKRAWELFNMINPVNHSDSPEKCGVYKVEPYVMAADIYTAKSNNGRGGWTWYTGSASWMYQLIVKYLLGIRLKVDRIFFEPCLPEAWQSFKIHYRYRETFYHIHIKRSGPGDTVASVTLDGELRDDKALPLADDRLEHDAEVIIGQV
jgi:cellobiose phosphorylase